MPYVSAERRQENAIRYRAANPEKMREYRKRYQLKRDPEFDRVRHLKWRRANPDKVRASRARWRQNNPEAVKLKKQRYAERHRLQLNERSKIYIKHRRSEDPMFRLLLAVRSRLSKVVSGELKPKHSLDLAGCSFDQLIAHLEVQFRPGMTWENYGPVWHIDHKRPCAAFDFSQPDHIAACFNYRNLQPLFTRENLSKGAKIL